jgi:ElaB/YqjD/DUF883 family membrane-anchored ribosome-binding protein
MSQTLEKQITKINEFESMKESESSEKASEKPGGAIAEPAADLKAATAAIAEELRAAAESKAEALKRQLADYVKENPFRAILTALGVGVLIGGLLRR